jgi:hypothetical protein
MPETWRQGQTVSIYRQQIAVTGIKHVMCQLFLAALPDKGGKRGLSSSIPRQKKARHVTGWPATTKVAAERGTALT